MANFYSFYPPSGGANPSVGTNGVTAPTSSTEVGGINPSGNLQPLQTDSAGNLLVSLSADPIDPLGVNIEKYGGVATTLGQKAMAASIPVAIASDQSAVPISAASLPLPTGAATSANQTTEITALTALEANQTNGTQVTSITGTLPLPTGAATAANQTNGSQETQIVQGGNTATVSAAGALKVDGSAVIQPVSAASLPLPAGASTSALQSNVQSAPGTPQTTAITIQGNASGIAVPISGSVTATNSANGNTGSAVPVQATQVGGTDGTNLRALSVNTSGQLNVNNISGTVSLPTGAATDAHLTNVQSSIGTSATTAITVQGAASGVDLPVSINASITVPISGVVIADIKDSAGLSLNSNGAGALTIAGITAAGSGASSGLVTVQGNASGTPIPISGSVTASGTVAATQSGTWTVQPGNTANTTPWLTTINQGGNSATVTASNALKVDGSAVTQPVSGTVTVTQSTAANLNATVTGTVAATQSGTWNVNNVSGTVSLPTGASTSALQSSVQGSVSAGTAATNSQLSGAVYSSSTPSLTNGQQIALQVNSSGSLLTSSTPATSSTSTITSVGGATSSTSLLASNTSRKGAYFFNDSTAILYLAFASSASTTAYTVQIASNGFYEMPNPTVYTGSIFGIWSAANGNVRITELS